MRTVPKPPTPAQQKVLDFIASRQEFPTAREISDHMGWQGTSGAFEVLRKMQWRGFLVRDAAGNRRVVGAEANASTRED